MLKYLEQKTMPLDCIFSGHTLLGKQITCKDNGKAWLDCKVEGLCLSFEINYYLIDSNK